MRATRPGDTSLTIYVQFAKSSDKGISRLNFSSEYKTLENHKNENLHK